MKKPVIAIPIGDPAGVGPEIVAKSIASDEVFQIAVCVICLLYTSDAADDV